MTKAPLPRATTLGLSRATFLALWLSVVVVLSCLLFTYRLFAAKASGVEPFWPKLLLEESISVTGGALLFFAIRWLVERYPWTVETWQQRLGLYAGSFLALSAVHTTWNWGVRTVFFALCGFGRYDYGIMPLRYIMELPADIIGFSLMTALIHGVDRIRAAAVRELHTAQLETSLARAQVKNLRLQLQPHFLFNALNTVSAVMYDDPAAADEILDRLATLLRASLATSHRDEVPLATELAILDAYVAILEARFGERIQVKRQIGEGLQDAFVPSMLLQPLFENAIRHGNAERKGHATITLTVERDGEKVRSGETLRLEVHDDGPGHPASCNPLAESGGGSGLGLRATAERLELLYGTAASFAAGNDPEGGFRVTLRVPLRRPFKVSDQEGVS